MCDQLLLEALLQGLRRGRRGGLPLALLHSARVAESEREARVALEHGRLSVQRGVMPRCGGHLRTEVVLRRPDHSRSILENDVHLSRRKSAAVVQ